MEKNERYWDAEEQEARGIQGEEFDELVGRVNYLEDAVNDLEARIKELEGRKK